MKPVKDPEQTTPAFRSLLSAPLRGGQVHDSEDQHNLDFFSSYEKWNSSRCRKFLTVGFRVVLTEVNGETNQKSVQPTS